MLPAYASREYVFSLAEIGTPRPFHNAGGWWLERTIHGTSAKDGCGAYPLLCCRDWHGLEEDFQLLEGKIASFCAVIDPFGAYDKELLARLFPDHLLRYKEHLIADLSRPMTDFVSAHHQRDTLRAQKRLQISRTDNPVALKNEWITLYTTLIERHAIQGPAALSPPALAAQLAVTGIQVFCAHHAGEIVAMQLWVENSSVAYYHLAASSAIGYTLGASYALTWAALEHFARLGIEQVDLGAAPDSSSSSGAGLLRFKAGWSTGTKTAYLGGRILDHKTYATLAGPTFHTASGYFPLYRKPQIHTS